MRFRREAAGKIIATGESLWAGLEGIEERFNVETVSSPSGVAHLTFTRR